MNLSQICSQISKYTVSLHTFWNFGIQCAIKISNYILFFSLILMKTLSIKRWPINKQYDRLTNIMHVFFLLLPTLVLVLFWVSFLCIEITFKLFFAAWCTMNKVNNLIPTFLLSSFWRHFRKKSVTIYYMYMTCTYTCMCQC